MDDTYRFTLFSFNLIFLSINNINIFFFVIYCALIYIATAVKQIMMVSMDIIIIKEISETQTVDNQQSQHSQQHTQ